MTVVATSIPRPPRVYGRSASISCVHPGGTSTSLRHPVAHPPLLLSPAGLSTSLSAGAVLDEDPDVDWTSVMAISSALCQAMSAASPVREDPPTKLLPQPMRPFSPASALSAVLSADRTSTISSTRSSSLSSLDSSPASGTTTAVTTPRDLKRPLPKTARIDPAPPKVLPLLPVRPAPRELPPLPQLFYFYPHAEAAPASARVRPGSRSRSATPALATYHRAPSVAPAADGGDEEEEFLAPSETPCVLCRKDGLPCIPPRASRRSQGCCVLCRATGAVCQRAPASGAKRGRDSPLRDDAEERQTKRARR